MNLRPIKTGAEREREGKPFGNSPRFQKFLTYVGYFMMVGIGLLIIWGLYSLLT